MTLKIAFTCLATLCVIGLAFGSALAQGQPGTPPPPPGQPPKPVTPPPPAEQKAATQPAAQPPTAQPKPPTPGQPGQPAQPGQPTAQPEAKPKLPDRVYVKLATTVGDIILELNQEKAPISVANFLQYGDSGFYDGTIFHRVIKGFMIQAGGFDKDMTLKESKQPPIKNEWQNGLKNKRGTIAMARIGNKPDSATSQFFVNLVDNPALDIPRDGAGYAVFGRVIKGMEVVDKLGDVAVKMDARADQLKPALPVEPVIINKVSRVDPAEVKDALAAIQAQEAEEAKKAEEAAAKAAEAAKTAMEAGKEYVKSQGADITKGVTTPSGLWYVDVTPGTGAQPQPTDQVEVHYTGWLTNGTKFDSSVDRGQPAKFGLNNVIKGWTEGVGSMKVGGKRFLVVPPDLGYGPRGQPPKIPANSVLVFQVELLGTGPMPPPAPRPPITPPTTRPATPGALPPPPATGAQPKPATPPPPAPAGQPPKPATPPPPPPGKQ